MKVSESLVQRSIAQTAPLYQCELYRNNVGGFAVQDGRRTRYVKTGLCKGSSDLIGYTKTTITPDMVGKNIAIFTAIEVKRSDWKITKKFTETEKGQEIFIDTVKNDGGIAGFANSVEGFINVIGGKDAR